MSKEDEVYGCEVVIANFVFGSQTCGVLATKSFDFHNVCDKHFAELCGDFGEITQQEATGLPGDIQAEVQQIQNLYDEYQHHRGEAMKKYEESRDMSVALMKRVDVFDVINENNIRSEIDRRTIQANKKNDS